MATYNQQFGGYIADVPKLWFKRCDGRVFHFDELTQASVTPQVNQTEINAGWSTFPVAYLPGTSTFDLTATSSKFETDLFSMTNAVSFEENSQYETYVTEIIPGIQRISGSVTIPAGNNVGRLSFSVDAGNRLYFGQIPANDVAANAFVSYEGIYSGTAHLPSGGGLGYNPRGSFLISSVPGYDVYDKPFGSMSISNTGAGLVIVPQEVDVTYFYSALVLTNADDTTLDDAELEVIFSDSSFQINATYSKIMSAYEANIDNRSSAIGEAVLAYPVYGSGDDCTESSVIGKLYIRVYRARITGQPGFDTSYKSASTFQFTLSAIDAKRADEAVYSIAYVRN